MGGRKQSVEPGDGVAKRATLADVARLSGMSPTAVSLVLNDRPGSRLSAEAIDRIRQAARDLDYRPNPAARSLRMGKTRTVGFVSDDVTITRYASAMIRGALDVAEAHDHTVLIAEAGSNPKKVRQSLAAMIDRRADGVIFAQMGAKEIDVPPMPSDLPVVLLNCNDPTGLPSVLPAEREAGYRIARLLLDQGHRRIGLIGYSKELWSRPRLSATVGSRYEGIFAALAEEDVRLAARFDERLWEPEVGFQAMTEFLDSGTYLTAVIALNDRLAFGAYQALAERGRRVPDEVSIASFDDDVIAGYLRPGLTTAQIPYELMGRRAMEMVLGERPAERCLVPMPVIVRGSVTKVVE